MTQWRINLRHLSCFREVAHRKSINAASAYVHLSQPAITQALAKLENQLGHNLFVRQSSGMFVTEHGEVLLRRVERALNYFKRGAREALRLAQRDQQTGRANFHQLATAAQFRALIAVVEAGNFSLAARRMNASQPSIHRRSRDLEQLTGVTLLEKTRAGIEPTAAARTLVRYAKLAFAEIETGEGEVKALSGRDAGRVVIGAMPLARAFILPKILPKFTSEFPDHRVRIVEGPYEQLLAGLRHGDLDVMLGAERTPAPIDDVVQQALFEDPLALIMRKGHPLAKRKSLKLEELVKFPWIVARPGTPLRERFDDLFGADPALTPTRLIECGSTVASRGLLLESDQLTLLSPHQVHYEIKAGLLIAAPHPLGPVGRMIAATIRRDWAPTRAQAYLMQLLQETNFDAL